MSAIEHATVERLWALLRDAVKALAEAAADYGRAHKSRGLAFARRAEAILLCDVLTAIHERIAEMFDGVDAERADRHRAQAEAFAAQAVELVEQSFDGG